MRDLTGLRFHRLLVVRRVVDQKSNTRWECRCDCGRTTVAVSGNLTRGRHKSCGCWRQGPTARNAIEKTMQAGYVFIKDKNHPRANPKTGRVREHIVVMEQVLGRHLMPGEEVHHINGVRSDNRPENLELWSKSHPAGARVSDKVEWAKQILRLYCPESLSNKTQ